MMTMTTTTTMTVTIIMTMTMTNYFSHLTQSEVDHLIS